MSEARIYGKTEEGELLRGFLNRVLKDIMSVLNAECGSLFLFDSEQKELILDSFYNSGNLNLKGLKQRVGEGISGKVVESKIPILVRNIDVDGRFKRNGFNHYHTGSFISLPLIGSQAVLGVINIADKSNGESFSENDLQFAVALAKYACIIAEDLVLFSKLKNEKEALDKQKSLLEKYASVGKLAAGVVHEVNNPLDGIIRYTNILLAQIEKNDVAREYLLEIKKGLGRIATITKSLLEFSRHVNSRPAQVKRYVDLHGLIDESLELLKNKINGNTEIHKKYGNSFPRILDMGLQHVFVNLIKNALDAMSDGGRLDITTNINDLSAEITFKDTGLGISRELRERIFEPFFTTKSIDKGTGLGLAMCQEIVHKYDGRIEVESAPGEGSIFTIKIPRKHLEND